MNKIKKISIVIISVIITLTVVYIYFSSKNKYGPPHFIQYNSSFAADVNSSYVIDLAYFVERNYVNPISNKRIGRVAFKKSKLTKITDFKFIKSDTSNKYDINNISMSVDFIEKGVENITELEIHYEDGSIVDYNIGNWFFCISDMQTGDHLEMGSKFPLIASAFHGYNFNFKNLTDQDIEVDHIEMGFKNVEIRTPKMLLIKAQHEIGELLPLVMNNLTNSNKFYIIRPRVDYNYNGNTYSYYPYATYYGFLSLTEEDIEKEVLKTLNLK